MVVIPIRIWEIRLVVVTAPDGAGPLLDVADHVGAAVGAEVVGVGVNGRSSPHPLLTNPVLPFVAPGK